MTMATRGTRNPARRKRSSAAETHALPLLAVWVALLALGALAGCESDDCVGCVDLPPPVVPTGVHSISGNNEVIVQWYDISYPPYDGRYNENVVTYYVYRRDYDFGDEYDPDRTFDYLTEVAWDENYDEGTGLHWYIDGDVVNGLQYEYAVAAVNAAGLQSALSYEFVADAPLPMSPLDAEGWHIPLRLFDANGANAALSGFNFSLAALSPSDLNAGRTDPAGADIVVAFDGGVPYVTATSALVRLQDFGVFSDGAGHVLFEGVSWAPVDGYSQTGTMELITGHVYVVEIAGPSQQSWHYAKFGVHDVGSGYVDIIWAYQLIENLPELKQPSGTARNEPEQPQTLSL